MVASSRPMRIFASRVSSNRYTSWNTMDRLAMSCFVVCSRTSTPPTWLSLLLYRRLTNPRIRAVTSLGDKVLMIWILLTLLLGLTTIIVSAGHMDGAEMVRLMTWAQHIVTFQSDAASLIADVSIIFKLHLFMDMTLFILFPFTRLVHVWSGFASLTYLGRAWQLVRQR